MDDAGIQDIHVSRNIIERWLGIGKVEIRTAAGSSSAEPALEGMEHWDPVRDYLYRRMRRTGFAATSEGTRRARVSATSTMTRWRR